jgi:hypothetical protein
MKVGVQTTAHNSPSVTLETPNLPQQNAHMIIITSVIDA